MSDNWKSRTELLLGKERMERLQNSHVLVAGLGGVGAYAAEEICRAGVGEMTIVDADTINESNLNRQLPALHSTLGRMKADVMAERLKDINPDLKLTVIKDFIRDEKTDQLLDSTHFDFVVDAIDTLSPKVFFIRACVQRGLKLVSSMGAGAKLDPEQVKITDISKSFNCHLARMVRKKLHPLGIRSGFAVVFSGEPADENAIIETEGEQNKLTTTGTVSYMTALFGCYLASYVIRNI
jgi:tRNA A37 threonylcarbamoyladenosine dehydratase